MRNKWGGGKWGGASGGASLCPIPLVQTSVKSHHLARFRRVTFKLSSFQGALFGSHYEYSLTGPHQNLRKKKKGGRRGGFSTLKIQCSITFITLISFKTLTTDTSVSFGCKPYLTQKVLFRATATVTKILGMKKTEHEGRCSTFVSLFNF